MVPLILGAHVEQFGVTNSNSESVTVALVESS